MDAQEVKVKHTSVCLWGTFPGMIGIWDSKCGSKTYAKCSRMLELVFPNYLSL